MGDGFAQRADVPSQTSLTTAFKVRHDDPADSAPPGASIVGLWEMANTPNIGPNAGKVTLRGIESWHSDGTEALNDFHNPAGGNVCLGVWMQTGPRTFKLKHPYWMWDSTGTLIGSGVLRWEVTVDADGNSYTGTFTNDQVDLLGNSVNHVAGDTKATRITVD